MSNKIIYLLLAVSLGLNAGLMATTLVHREGEGLRSEAKRRLGRGGEVGGARWDRRDYGDPWLSLA